MDRSEGGSSLNQVRRPLYRSSIGRWRAYADHLGPLLETLGIDPAAAPAVTPVAATRATKAAAKRAEKPVAGH